MDKYCGNCGHTLSDGAKFCANCGQPLNAKNEEQNIAAESKKEPVNVKNEKQNMAAESKKEPVKENANENSQKGNAKQKESENATTPKGNAKQKEGGFIATLVNEVKDLIRHPKKLLPTIILSVVWMVFSMLSTFGVNIPILRFLYTLTYSNGGMFGGFFGAVGGIFGKAVFAAVVNTIVLSLVAKKNPFANAAKSLKGIFGKAAFSGLSAISPFLIGAGSGLVLYWFFNITSSPVNCSVAVVGAVGAFTALGKKNGLLTSLVYTVTGKLTKGKFPSQVTVNRTITGFSAGFALGLPLTFVRFGWLLFLVGALILTLGIVFSIVGKKGVKKMAATAAIFILMTAMMMPMFYTNVFAADSSLPKKQSTSGGRSTAITKDDPDYKPYRGYLTYTNGEKNKHGQPFPDLMDFNDDGEINWLDVAIQKELSHNPDWLDLPASKAAGAALAVITALLGAAGGVVGGALGGPLGSLLGSAAQAAASAAEGALGGTPDISGEPEQKEDLGKYIRRDPDGDLYVKDPVTGKETLYVRKEDGRYRNTVSEQDYTLGEINDMLSHAEDNKGYYSDISKKQQEAVAYQHEHASDFSETSVKLAEETRQQKEQEAREDAINKIGYKHGVYNGDEDAIRERLEQHQATAESLNEAYHRSAAHIDTAVKVAEGTKKVADVAADVVATADKTGIFKDVYSATTAAAGNAGEVMAGNMTAEEAVAKTAVEASTEIIKNRAQSTGAKFAANILGDSAQDATSAMLEGKNLDEVTDAAIEGAGRGLLDSTVDYAISTGNKAAASSGGTSLTDAGETLTSDLVKSALPKVEVPKKKEE